MAAEHLATEVVLHVLRSGLRLARGDGPLLLAGCLPAERHEWGVLSALVVAQEDGWRVHYLGADLPVEAIGEAAGKLSPAAVGLSGSDPGVVRASLPALAALRARLPAGTLAVLGGRGVGPYTQLLRGYGYRIGLGALGVVRH